MFSFFFSDIYLGVELLGQMVVLFLVFWEIYILFSTVAAPIYIPTYSVQEFPILTSLPTFVICVLFDDSHSDSCELISHCGFGLHFSDEYWCWALFPIPVVHLYVFFGETSIQVPWPFLIRLFVFCFCLLLSYEFHIYFGY